MQRLHNEAYQLLIMIAFSAVLGHLSLYYNFNYPEDSLENRILSGTFMFSWVLGVLSLLTLYKLVTNDLKRVTEPMEKC